LFFSEFLSGKNHPIEVVTEKTDFEGDVVTYEYSISAGKIIGSGANVVWDLSGVKPGIYTMRA
jgi:hypothetical protein